jgi:photosystem II stability/assembly factor-like uncharacterized protein
LTTPWVDALAIDPNAPNTLYAGTRFGGVFKSTDAQSWTPVNMGLTNLAVDAVAVDPSGQVYAGTLGGAFVSTDGGGHWSSDNSGITNASVRTLTFDLSLGKVYAGTDGGGLFRR